MHFGRSSKIAPAEDLKQVAPNKDLILTDPVDDETYPMNRTHWIWR
jgi:hypothetical protein